MTKDLGNIAEIKRAIDDVRQEKEKVDRIVKHCNADQKWIVKKNLLEQTLNALQERLKQYNSSK